MRKYLTITVQFLNAFTFVGLFTTTMSCASMANKTAYCTKNFSIPKSAKIIITKPTLIVCTDCDENEKDTYRILKNQLSLDLKPYNISTLDDNMAITENFDAIKADNLVNFNGTHNADFILLTKVTSSLVMQTSDYKIEYKLVSVSDKKLQFHSKYNSKYSGGVVVLLPWSEYPNSEKLMRMAISGALHQLKKQL
jgi:hypothetical protein